MEDAAWVCLTCGDYSIKSFIFILITEEKVVSPLPVRRLFSLVLEDGQSQPGIKKEEIYREF